MTTFFVAMLVIAIIVLIARYYSSPSLASNLLITLALGVVMGLGIQSAIGKSKVEKNTKIEKFTTTISNPTQSCIVLQTTTDDPLETVGKEEKKNSSKLTTKDPYGTTSLLSWTRGSPFPFNSS